MRVALYACSIETDQHSDLQILRDDAARRGWAIAGEYVDQGWPREKIKCPELDRLMHDARLHVFDAVICLSLVGFPRSILHSMSVIQELSSLGVRFLSVSQGFDTDQSNPESQRFLDILASISRLEHQRKGERILKGMMSARAKGKQVGRSRSDIDRHRLRELRAKGMSYAAIARELGIGYGTVARFFAEPSKKLPG